MIVTSLSARGIQVLVDSRQHEGSARTHRCRWTRELRREIRTYRHDRGLRIGSVLTCDTEALQRQQEEFRKRVSNERTELFEIVLGNAVTVVDKFDEIRSVPVESQL